MLVGLFFFSWFFFFDLSMLWLASLLRYYIVGISYCIYGSYISHSLFQKLSPGGIAGILVSTGIATLHFETMIPAIVVAAIPIPFAGYAIGKWFFRRRIVTAAIYTALIILIFKIASFAQSIL